MKTVKISLNSIDKVKSFVNDITKFDVDFDLVSGLCTTDSTNTVHLTAQRSRERRILF